MRTAEVPMLSSDTDLSDDEKEKVESTTNEVTSGTSDERAPESVQELSGDSMKPMQLLNDSRDQSPCLSVLDDILKRNESVFKDVSKVEKGKENMLHLKKGANSGLCPTQECVESSSSILAKDSDSRGSTCRTRDDDNIDQNIHSHEKESYVSTGTNSTSKGGNVISSVSNTGVEIEILESEKLLRTTNTNTSSNEFESLDTLNSGNSNTTSTDLENENGFCQHSPSLSPTLVQDGNHVPLIVPEIIPFGSQDQLTSQYRNQPIGVVTNNFISMETQATDGTSHSVHQISSLDGSHGRFLITVPTDPRYVNPLNFATSAIPANHSLPHASISNPNLQSSSGRRSIRLRLVEDKDQSTFLSGSKRMFFSKSFKKKRAKSLSVLTEDKGYESDETTTNSGTVVVSWYQGTTSMELQDHVRNSVCRELGKKVEDIRLLDESVVPHEEIVLTPFIPDGSQFMVKFKIRPPTPTKTVYQYASEAPDSPSRAPTPCESEVELLDLDEDPAKSDGPKLPLLSENKKTPFKLSKNGRSSNRKVQNSMADPDDDNVIDKSVMSKRKSRLSRKKLERILSQKTVISGNDTVEKIIYKAANKSQEKKHVIFVIANYFVLFLTIIAISAEIHERGPRWVQWMEENVDRVHACAVDRDSLFECISNGDLSGLLASIVLWVARSNKITIRFFLFGFDSVNKLWTVVYEALVTAICWGTSYLFIRRGLNPDTRTNFLEKYWKDAIYGSLAGFNAAFLKAILKNLIPKEVLEEMVDNNRQLRIIEIFANIFANKSKLE